MVICFACQCHSSDRYAYKIMSEAGVDAYDIPLVRGKEAVFNTLTEMNAQGYDVAEVRRYISEHTKFIIFFGYTDPGNVTVWKNATAGDTESLIAAKSLVKAFAQN